MSSSSSTPPVYSTAFIRERNFGSTISYTVPQGQRAIVTHMSVYNGAVDETEPPWVSVTGGAGETIWNVEAPVSSPVAATWYDVQEGRWVIYSLEKLTIVSSGSNDVYIGGYLLTN